MKVLKLFILLLIFLGLNLQLSARQHSIDSILTIANQFNGTEKAEYLINLSNQLVYRKTGESLLLAEKAFEICSELQHDSLKFAALKAMGYANGYLGNFEASMQNMKDGLAYYESIHDSSKIAEALSDVAYLLLATSSSEENIMEYNLNALAIREKIGDEKGVAYSLNNIGALYWKWKKFDQSIIYFLKALPYLERLQLKEEVATTTGNIGSYYIETGDYDSAENFLNKALESYTELDHKYGEAMILATLSRLYYRQKMYDKAIDFNEKSKTIRMALGDKEGLVGNYYNIGLYHLEMNELSKAETNLTESRNLAEEIGSYDRLIQINQSLSDLGIRQNNYEAAYAFLLKSKVLSDSIFSVEKHQQLEEIKIKFDVEKKEAENLQLVKTNEIQQLVLKKNRFIFYLSLSMAFLTMLFIVLFFQKRRTADQMNALVAEQRMLRSQMNPHFIFNSITAIQNYIFNHSSKEAANYLSAFASLMRQILENSRKEFIEIGDELKWLENYFSLQKLRYSNRFDYQIELDETLLKSTVLIPPMVIQPFIENAIEHGIKELSQGGFIWLRYKKWGSLIEVEIEDNGIGILKSRQQNHNNHSSFALAATRKRLQVMHKREKTKFSFEMIDKSEISKELNGTIVRFSLPYIEKF